MKPRPSLLLVCAVLVLAGCENALLEKALAVKAGAESAVLVVTDASRAVIPDNGTVSFPDTSVGGVVHLSLMLINSGHTELVIDTAAIALTITSGEAGSFTLDALPSTRLGVGSTTVLELTFAPHTVGLKTAKLDLPSSDIGHPRQSFVLRGNGFTGAKDIVAFGFTNPTVTGVVSGTSIQVEVPIGTDLTLLVASFTTTGVSVTVNGSPQTSGSTSVDYSHGAVNFLVKADDASTKSYSVLVTPVVMKPLLTTAVVSSIASTSAVGGGNISNSGGAAVTSRGLCWSTMVNPTTADGIVPSGAGVGDYSTNCLLSGLVEGTIYYVRAYATNSAGTAYGPQVSFTTRPAPPASPSVFAVGDPSGSGQLAVTWAAVLGSVSYDVYFSTSATIPGAPNGPTNVTATSCTLQGLTNYVSYYVWVVARNASGPSLPSATGSATMVGIKVASITLDKATVKLWPGSSEIVTATISPANATQPAIVWTSSVPAYVSVSNGRATGVGGETPVPAGVYGVSTIAAAPADGQGATVRTFTATNTQFVANSVGPAGGYLYYDSGSYGTKGWRYLEAASANAGASLYWRNGASGLNIVIPGAYGTDFGTGKANTDAIIAAQGAGSYMASACRGYTQNGYSDWFMPSQYEANQMLYVVTSINYASLWGFASSSQYNNGSGNGCWAYHQDQNAPYSWGWFGTLTSWGGYSTYLTRPARSF